MRIFAKSDTGRVRDVNQDFYYVYKDSIDMQLCILADGMGGYTGGEVASSLATECVKEHILNNFKKVEHDDKEIEKMIKDSIDYANMKVNEKAETEELDKMGTTLEICLIYNNKAYIGHIGDSRIYMIRDEKMTKITTDHSYVEELVKDGTITEEEAYVHPKKNMLTKALGCGIDAQPDVIIEELKEKDKIMMCTDGLSNMTSEDEIVKLINRAENIEVATEMLIDAANEAGGHDNVSVILIENS